MRQTWLITLGSLVLLAGGSFALFLLLRPAPLSEQLIYGNGHVEGTEVRVSSEVNGRVLDSTMVEGATVEAGSVLVHIDPTQLKLEREKANAEAQAIELELQGLEKELGIWRHHLQTSETDFERYRELQKRGTVSPQKLEKAQDTFREARGRVGALEARVQALSARREAANKALGLIELNLSKTTISAPVTGTILAKAVEPGEFVQVGQTIAVIVDLSRVELKVFIPERDIGKIKLGDEARVRVDAFPDKSIAAKVARIDQKAQFTPREIHVPKERVRMVFGVTLQVENLEHILKPGMPADAWILWKRGAQWPKRLLVPQ